MEATAKGSVSSALRFLGWTHAHAGITHDVDLRVFKRPDARKLLDDYVTFLVEERGIGYGSVASYVNGIMSIMQFVAGELMEDGEEASASQEEAFAAAFNLRNQAEYAARQDAMFKPRSKEWMSWDECQEMRQNCLDEYDRIMDDPEADRKEKLQIATEATLLCLQTILPPGQSLTPSLRKLKMPAANVAFMIRSSWSNPQAM